jgi:hypothetical protein
VLILFTDSNLKLLSAYPNTNFTFNSPKRYVHTCAIFNFHVKILALVTSLLFNFSLSSTFALKCLYLLYIHMPNFSISSTFTLKCLHSSHSPAQLQHFSKLHIQKASAPSITSLPNSRSPRFGLSIYSTPSQYTAHPLTRNVSNNLLDGTYKLIYAWP